jgi:hypothetical protein
MRRSWIKLYLEILDDVKLAELPEAACWRFVQLLLVAAERDEGGILPPSKQLAWRLRADQAQLLEDLRALGEVGVMVQVGEHWKVTNFEKRQATLTDAERASQYRGRQRQGVVTDGVTKSDRERVTVSTSPSTSPSTSVSDSGGEGVGEGGTPAAPAGVIPPPGKGEALAILLQASQLAALPPSERARVEQVRAMVATYGSDDTLAELLSQRREWCQTRGRNGRYYSPLNMGWVDRADEALSGAGAPPEPPEVRLPPPLPRADPVPRPPDVPLPKFRRAKRDGEG